MAQELAIKKHSSLAKRFQWKDRKDNFFFPEEMDTRHLYYTVRMIWNHTMPDKIGSFIEYTFPEFYTPEYMADAVQHLGLELLKRNDLQEEWREGIQRIAGMVNQQKGISREGK